MLERHFNLRIRQESGVCLIEGWSVGDKILDKYDELMQFISVHLEKNDRIIIYFQLHLFDLKSLSKMFKMIKVLNHYHSEGKKVFVKWGWRDAVSLMKRSGEDIKELCNFSFELFKY
ncbi:SiaC family regulatory phosphoprotein [Ekhidna sp.]|uniref:SiaC family regulatory phosphoprotein n=1 Tax=Ekhidna sp. TaxID=2608089 RepID=UPI0032EFB063